MNIVENIWILDSLIITVLILSTDPKSSTSSVGNDNINSLFSSTSESQKFVRNLSWFLIFSFYFLTVCIN